MLHIRQIYLQLHYLKLNKLKVEGREANELLRYENEIHFENIKISVRNCDVFNEEQ